MNPEPGPPRRGFFGFLLGGLSALMPRPKRLLGAAGKAAPRPRRWGMVIDLDKCTGCGACVDACRAENNVPVAGPERTAEGRAIYWMDMLSVKEGEYPDLRWQIIPTPCNHCDNPPCVRVCPVGATFINEEGIVAQIWARCIGCRYCTTACPYTRRYFNWVEPSWPEDRKSQLNPDVATRPKGVVEKCTFCHHRIRAARERAREEGKELADGDVRRLPACAQSCPADAITFGDLNDPDSEVSRLSRSPRVFRLQEERGTEPKVYYLRESKWKE
jgi:molybdopterin-containing oxidoreductase family iron-sulfur binding subunit